MPRVLQEMKKIPRMLLQPYRSVGLAWVDLARATGQGLQSVLADRRDEYVQYKQLIATQAAGATDTDSGVGKRSGF